ncbi:MAG TPA: extracellular solute-binding protein [Bdellovibrionota bacterium]|jgi:iron(III) transport system substrate-binding protein|nr:extracellular solute-binding protein [Bdellovibrionota bacterium]
MQSRILSVLTPLFCAVTPLALAGGAAKSTDALTIYTSSNEEFIRPIFEKFTQESGIKINFVADKGPVLIEKLKAEGANSPADLLTTVDVGNLWLAGEAGLLAPTQSAELEANLPAQYRAPHNEWVGLSIRARTIFYNPKKVKASQLSTYEDLASPKWKGKLCLRTSNNVYNQSLVASFIENWGEKKTETVLKGWVRNLAAPVFASDTPMLEAIAAGQCAVGISNSYYFARLIKDKPSLDVKLFWADQGGRGTHVNVMGGGVLKASKKKELATQFLVWASRLEAQKLLSAMNYEYPVNPKAEVSPQIQAFGNFKPDAMPLYKAGEKQRAAVQLMDRVGYK